MRRKRTDENRTGEGGSQSNENVLFGNVIFLAVTTSGRFSSVGWRCEGQGAHKVTRLA
jgi:hypothetical protein